MVDFLSLDGHGAADGWPGYWGLEGPEYLAWLGEAEIEHAALMGATTYRLEYVPTVLDGPPGDGAAGTDPGS